MTNLSRYQLLSVIGKGSFGVIHKVVRKDDNVVCALKELDYSRMPPKDRKQMLQEVSILDSLHHENVVQLIDKIIDKAQQKLYIVMEYCGGGDLSSIISLAKRQGKSIPETKIWSIFVQLVLALHHCHWPEERGMSSSESDGSLGATARASATMKKMVGAGQVLHRDLKPENIFLTDTKEIVKLGDFGLSKNLGSKAFTDTYVGTPLYMPPEILQENRYDTKSDIWSLGCLIFELCTLSSPFSEARTQPELLTKVNSGRIPPLPTHISKELKEIVRSMLQLQPSRRPSTTDLLNGSELRIHLRVHHLNVKANQMILKKRAIDEREISLLTREASIDERCKQLDLREREIAQRQQQLETDLTQAQAWYEQFQKEKAGLEMAKARFSETNSTAGTARLSEAGSDLLASPSVQASRLPRRSSQATRPALGDASSYTNATNAHPASHYDTPSKVPILTPSRTLHKARSLSNIAQENRSPEPMDLSTPYKQNPYRSSVSSPADLRTKLEAAQRETARLSVNPTRPPLHHAATTTELPRQSRPPLASTNSFTFLGTPAKWSANDPDAPSPFLKREPPPPPKLSDDHPQPRGNFSKRPSVAGPSDLRRLATMAHARVATRQSTEHVMDSPLRSRAALAQLDAMRAMGGS